MKTTHVIALATMSFAIGGVAVHTLHAQTKGPVYYVGEVDVTDETGYQKEFVSQSGAAVQSSGGHFLVRGGKTTGLAGDPPKNRIVIQQWDSIDQLRSRR